MECSKCGSERPDKGTCRSCGSVLCCTCRKVLDLGRKSPRCPDCSVIYNRQWKANNAELVAKQNRRWAEAHPDYHQVRYRGIRAAGGSYPVASPHVRRTSNRRWKVANREKVKEAKSRRRAQSVGNRLGPVDLQLVVEEARGICAACRTFVPDGMRHIDHVIPLGRGGPHSQDNLQLLCYRCNTSKGAKMPDEVNTPTWAPVREDQPFLLNPDWR
jgi:5-methylcytosine-specific restriction endonuclease McrA